MTARPDLRPVTALRMRAITSLKAEAFAAIALPKRALPIHWR
jgi:hypothetical protein